MSEPRKRYSAQDKGEILRRHLVEKQPISDLCVHYGMTPAMFYRWQKEFFERGCVVFQATPSSPTSSLQQQLTALQAKHVQKNEVLAELMEEHIRLKKKLGVL